MKAHRARSRRGTATRDGIRYQRGSMTQVIGKSELTRRQSYTANRDDHIPPERDHVELTYADGRATIVVYEGSADHFDFTEFAANEPMDPKEAYRRTIDAAERFAIDLVVIPDGHETT